MQLKPGQRFRWAPESGPLKFCRMPAKVLSIGKCTVHIEYLTPKYQIKRRFIKIARVAL